MSEMPPAEPAAAPGGPPPGMAPHRGVLILVLGIVSIFCCGIIVGPIAFFLGKGDMDKMKTGQMDPAGQGMTKAGMICGIVGLVLSIIGIIVNVAINVAAASS